MALGMVEPALFSELIKDEVTDFSVGDLLCLFTDGVTEATNQEKEEFGLARLKDELLQNTGHTAQSLNQKIIRNLNKFSLQSLDRDDLTLLSVKRV